MGNSLSKAFLILVLFVFLVGCTQQAQTLQPTVEPANVTATPTPKPLTSVDVLEKAVENAGKLKNKLIAVEWEDQVGTEKSKNSVNTIIGEGQKKVDLIRDFGGESGVLLLSYYELISGDTVCYKNTVFLLNKQTGLGFCFPEKAARDSPSFTGLGSFASQIIQNPASYASFVNSLRKAGYAELKPNIKNREVNGRNCTEISYSGKNLKNFRADFTTYPEFNQNLRNLNSLEDSVCFDDSTGVPLAITTKLTALQDGVTISATSKQMLKELKDYSPTRQDFLTPYELYNVGAGKTVALAQSKENLGKYILAYPKEMVLGDQEGWDYTLSFDGGAITVALFPEGEGDLREAIKATMLNEGATQVLIERSLFSANAGRWSAVKSKFKSEGATYDWIRMIGEGNEGRIAVLDLYVDEAVGEEYYAILKEMAKSFTVLEPSASSN